MDIGKELECAICGNVMADPRVLVCQHVFCMHCLFHLVKRDQSNHVEIRCPFNCKELTVVDKGITSLHRNPLISGLCSSVRKEWFESGKLARCDWCSSEPGDKSVRQCEKCTAVLCANCYSGELSDHEVLCNVMRTKKNKTQIFNFLITKEQAVDAVRNKLAQLRGLKDLQISFEISSVYYPFFQCGVNCEGTQGSVSVALNYPALVAGNSEQPSRALQALQLCEKDLNSLSPPIESPELPLLFEVKSTLLCVTNLVTELKHIADTVTQALNISVSQDELSFCMRLCVTIEHLLFIERLCIRPACQRLALSANMIGYGFDERASQKISHKTVSGQRYRLQQELHRKYSTLMNGEISKLMEKGSKIAQAARNSVTNAFSALHTRTMRTPNGGLAAATKRKSLFSIDKMSEALLKLTDEIATLRSNVEACCETAFSEAIKAAAITEDVKTSFVEAAKKEMTTTERLVSLFGSLQHLHVLYGQMSQIQGPVFEHTHLVDMFNLIDIHGIIELPDLVAVLTPQIQGIREQHAQLHPQLTPYQNVLQSQLAQLLVQAIELFQKEHLIQTEAVLDQQSTMMLQFAHRLFASFNSCRKGVLDEALLEQNFTEHVADLIHTAGTFLNKECGRSGLEKFALQNRIAKAFLTSHSGKETVPDTEMQPFVTRIVPSLSHVVDAPLTAEGRERALGIARTNFQRDSGVKNISTKLDSSEPARILLPFYCGSYQAGGSERTFRVNGQTGNVDMLDLPPRKGVACIREKAFNILGSRLGFLLANVMILAVIGGIKVTRWAIGP